jgi:hypothetical protein
MKTRSWRNKTVLLLLLEMIITTRCYSVGPALLYYYIKSAARMCRHVISWKQVHYLFGSCGRGDGSSSFCFGKERNFYVRAVFYDTQFRTFFFFFFFVVYEPRWWNPFGRTRWIRSCGRPSHFLSSSHFSFSFFNDGRRNFLRNKMRARVYSLVRVGPLFITSRKYECFSSLSRFTMSLYDGSSSLIRSKM